MKIKNINIINFRNYEKLDISFSDGINIFIGLNGTGKTNLLESIYVLALTRSHRAYIDKNLIKSEEEFLKINGLIETKDINKKLEIFINQKGKRVSINKLTLKKVSDYISNFAVVLFTPDDLELIKGSPGERRKFLNIEIGQLDNKYFYYLNDYNELIKNRNEYLKSKRYDNYDLKYIEVINNQIIDKAMAIYKYRFSFIKNIEENLRNIYKEISTEDIYIEYMNSCDIKEYDEVKIKDILSYKLINNLKKEAIQGSTLYGPHKDDFIVYIDGKSAREYASQGQQRLLVLGIKIAELDVFKKIKNEYPVLLLDDVFSELDINKKNKIISFLDKNIQVFITSTDIKNINKRLLINSKILNIKNGEIK
jgi:DNA replication and repair protein RecF